MKRLGVLVLTNRRDFGADRVIHELGELGIPVHRLNIEDALSGEAPQVWALDGQQARTFGCVWWRQFVPEAPTPSTIPAMQETLIQRRQWSSWLSVFDQPGVIWVNPPWEARKAENKVVQLRTAQACGFNTPSTIVTNSKESGRQFSNRFESVVVKALATAFYEFTDSSFVFTNELDEHHFQEPDTEWSAQPLVIQEHVDGEEEIRIIYLSGDTFGAKTDRVGTDWRTRSEPAVWDHYDVDTSMQRLCDRYAQRLGLRYAAFDFIVKGAQTYFLEANQAGEWAFLDRAHNGAISSAIATRLAAWSSGTKDDNP